jgi:hypothetical protein
MVKRTLPWALFVLSLATAITFALLWRGARADDVRRAEVAAAATRFLQALTNFKYTTIDSDVREIRSYAVGDFAQDVNQFFGAQAVQAIKAAKAQSVGQVRSVFIQSLAGSSSSVFGVVDEAVTNEATPTPRSQILRVDIEMIETKDGWKVNKVNLLQTPTGGVFGGG